MSVVRHEVLAQEAREIAGRLLLSGEVVGVVGLRSDHGCVGLHLFTAVDDLAALVLEPRYLLASACRTILSGLPEGRLGVVARGCDERALVEMAKLEQVNMERLVLIGLACSEDQARRCVCARPHPSQVDVGDEVSNEIQTSIRTAVGTYSLLHCWLADGPGGGETSAAPGDVVWNSGIVLETVSTKTRYWIITPATGVANVTVTCTIDRTWYWAVARYGRVYYSSSLNFDA